MKYYKSSLILSKSSTSTSGLFVSIFSSVGGTNKSQSFSAGLTPRSNENTMYLS